MSMLAVHGGRRIRDRGWTRWPQAAPRAPELLQEVLDSGRWAISGPYGGVPSFERRFAEAFAAFHGLAHCIPTASGTASLMVALEALGVGDGDEVIIPGLSWVANASTVAGVNAIPVPVDVDPSTLCMDPQAVRDAITPRTAAIVVVHLYSAVADLDALVAVADRHGIPIVEDCAQAHGAAYDGRPVGTFGVVGTFSMQHSKLLTSGEGGAVVTDSEHLSRLAEHLRADSRSYPDHVPAVGEMELEQTAEIMGSNRCLSEFQSAVLLAQLELLEGQNKHRAVSAAQLDDAALAVGLRPQATSAGTTTRTYYEWCAVIEDEELRRIGPDRLAAAIVAELNGPLVGPGYPSMNRAPLYRPGSRKRFAGRVDALDLTRFSLPVAEDAGDRVLTIHHSVLLGDDADIADVTAAFEKVSEHRHELLSPA